MACWIERCPWRWRAWGVSALSAVAVWIAVDLIKRHVGVYGPGFGATPVETTSLTDEARVVSAWLSFDWTGYLSRMDGLLAKLPELFGGRV